MKSRIDHDGVLVGGLDRQAGRDPGEHAHPAPALPAVIEGLGRAIFAGCIAPAQPIAVDKYYAAENTAIIDARTAMALAKEGLKPRHLASFSQKRLPIREAPETF